MQETWITSTGLKILELLERFQFMTAEQLTRAGNFKNKAVVRRVANDYAGRRAPLVHAKDFGAVPGLGRLHKIYALSAHGAEVLAEYRHCDLADVGHLTGKIQFSVDYQHRIDFVDVHIVLREWAETSGAEFGFFSGYFETEGANRSGKDALKLQKKNRVDLPNRRYIIPDGIFSFTYGQKNRLCALEIHRGKDTKTILEQLEKHIETLYLRGIQDKYRHETANFVLSVYENAGIMEAVKKRIVNSRGFSDVARAFHFATIEAVKADVRNAWTLADGVPISLFNT